MITDKACFKDWSKVREIFFNIFLIGLIFIESFKLDAKLFWFYIAIIFFLLAEGPLPMYLPDEGKDEKR
jgi:hypothetical protein